MKEKSLFDGKIRKAVLTEKNTLKVNYVDHLRLDDDYANAVTTRTWDQEVHKDLKTHFGFLKGHAAVWGALKPKSKEISVNYIRSRDCAIDPDLIAYEVRGFEYKGNEEPSVILHMRRNLPQGGHYDFKLPSIKLYEGSDYEFSGNLVDDLSDCEIEVARYMDGKFNDHGQLTLNLEEEEIDY